MAEIAQLKRIIEAALLASAHPLTVPQLSALFDEFDMPPPDELARALEELAADCADRGVELVEVASGFRYQIRQDVHAFVSRLWTERQSRYSRALLETLCLIAYRQPITRAEIEQIRGVAVSTNIVRTLEEREWVRVVGYRDLPGKPALFGTTKQFLDYFNLKSLDQLPPLSDIRDIEDLDPQLALGAEGGIPAAIDIDADAGARDAPADEESATDLGHDEAAGTQDAIDDDAATHGASTRSADVDERADSTPIDSTRADSAHTDLAHTDPAHIDPDPDGDETAAAHDPSEPSTEPDPAAADRDDESDPDASATTTPRPSGRAAPDTPDTSA